MDESAGMEKRSAPVASDHHAERDSQGWGTCDVCCDLEMRAAAYDDASEKINKAIAMIERGGYTGKRLLAVLRG